MCCFLCWNTVTLFCMCVSLFCKEKKNHIYFHYFCRQITWFWLYFSIYILYNLFNLFPPLITLHEKTKNHDIRSSIGFCMDLFQRKQNIWRFNFVLGRNLRSLCPRGCSETWIITHFERLTNLESVLWCAILFLMFV